MLRDYILASEVEVLRVDVSLIRWRLVSLLYQVAAAHTGQSLPHRLFCVLVIVMRQSGPDADFTTGTLARRR